MCFVKAAQGKRDSISLHSVVKINSIKSLSKGFKNNAHVSRKLTADVAFKSRQ